MGKTQKIGTEPSVFSKRIGRTLYKVNVYFAAEPSPVFEDRLLHFAANEIAKCRSETMRENKCNHVEDVLAAGAQRKGEKDVQIDQKF